MNCLYLRVCCSIVAASVADSHRTRGYYVELGLQDWALSEGRQLGVAPTDCLTGEDIYDRHTGQLRMCNKTK